MAVPRAGHYGLYFVYPMTRERGHPRVVVPQLPCGGVALILLLGAIAYVVTRLVVDPVRARPRRRRAVRRRPLGERMTAKGEDDIARLAASFNEMAATSSSRSPSWRTCRGSSSASCSDVSHELRTPLTTIRMAGDLMHDSRADFDPAVARSAELLHAELDRFEALLTDLLEISRFDAGAAALDLEATDLRAVAARVVESTATLAARRGSEVVVQDPGGPCIAEVDPRRVERILRNLLVNAIEHGEGTR